MGGRPAWMGRMFSAMANDPSQYSLPMGEVIVTVPVEWPGPCVACYIFTATHPSGHMSHTRLERDHLDRILDRIHPLHRAQDVLGFGFVPLRFYVPTHSDLSRLRHGHGQ